VTLDGQNSDFRAVVTLINVFTVELANRQQLFELSARAIETHDSGGSIARDVRSRPDTQTRYLPIIPILVDKRSPEVPSTRTPVSTSSTRGKMITWQKDGHCQQPRGFPLGCQVIHACWRMMPEHFSSIR
jgi:hypothetical protein